MFVDEARLIAIPGRGGDGAVSFHREKFKPKGGPDGGKGGKGGSVILRADEGIGSLAAIKDRPHRKAPSGEKGGPNNRSGADARDMEIEVPVGTIVRDSDGQILADLAEPGASFVVAQGGRGGRGNASFLSQERRAPGFAELGEPPPESVLLLEMRLIADVAVIGFPNAGKSTLVAKVSAARPKIADYAFTTLEPSLGVIERGDERVTICDVPGLIEGASDGKGLGHKFLRHAERAAVFLHLIDPTTERDPLDDYRIVRGEVEAYSAAMAQRTEVIAVNKVDVDRDAAEGVKEALEARGHEVLVISATSGTGLEELLDALFSKTLKAREADDTESFRLYRTLPEDRIQVEADGEGWRIRGGAVERWVAMTDMGNPEAVAYLQSRFDGAGVEAELKKVGASPGDDVSIGEATFEWWPLGSAPDDVTGLMP